MVSAYLVNPVKADKIALPTDGFVPATDAQTILMGKLNSLAQGRRTSAAATGSAAAGKTGFIVE